MDKPEIMTLEEVAEYLRISERTVYDWAQKGDIPCGKLGTAWRFRRTDIEEWVDNRLASDGVITKREPLFLNEVLKPEQVVFTTAMTKKKVLSELTDVLCETKLIKNRKEFIEGIFYREELLSTGIGLGVATPHVRLASVKDIVMAAAVVQGGIDDYESIDGESVKLVFMIAARKDQHVEHLKTMAELNTKLKDDDFKESLICSSDAKEFYDKITN